MCKQNVEIEKVSCLLCDWSSEEQSDIESANWYGECLSCQQGFLRWDYKDGGLAITNSKTDEKIEWVS